MTKRKLSEYKGSFKLMMENLSYAINHLQLDPSDPKEIEHRLSAINSINKSKLGPNK